MEVNINIDNINKSNSSNKNTKSLENKDLEDVNALTNKMDNLLHFKNDDNQYNDKSSLQNNFKSFMKMRKVKEKVN